MFEGLFGKPTTKEIPQDGGMFRGLFRKQLSPLPKVGGLLPTQVARQVVGGGLSTIPRTPTIPQKPSYLKRGISKISSFLDPPEGSKRSQSFLGQLPSAFVEGLPIFGEAIKQIHQEPEIAASITGKDLLKATPTAIKEVGKGIPKLIASGLLNIAGLFKGPFAGGDQGIKIKVPGLGEITNAQFNAAYRVSQGEDPVVVALQEGSGAILDTLFFVYLASKPFAPRNVKVLEVINYIKKPGIPIKAGPKSFRLYQQPTTLRPLPPQFINQMQAEGINLGKQFNSNFPTYFRISIEKGGILKGELFQIKLSYYNTFKNKLFGNVNNIPSNQIIPLLTKKTSIKKIETATKSPEITPVVPITKPIETAKPMFKGIFKKPAISKVTPKVALEPQKVVPKAITPEKGIISKELEPLPIHLQKKTVEAMTKAYKERDPVIMERTIAMIKKGNKISVLEGEHRFFAAKKAGVEPPMVLLTENQTDDLNAPQIDTLAKKIYTGKNIKELTDFYNQATKAVKPEVKEVKKPALPKKVVKEVKPAIPKAKLPEAKKIPKEKGVKLYAIGAIPDPGLDKFLAEELRPILNKATEAGKYLWKMERHIPEFMMRIIEPAKLVPGKAYATVIRGIHKPEAKLVEFDQKRLDTMDTNLSELEKWFNKFSDKELENLMLTRGKPTSAEALTIQKNVIKETPKELQVPAIKRAIQEIADFNYNFLQETVGDGYWKDIHKAADYFYGVYKNPKTINKFLDYWKSTEKFTEEKVFPTLADAKAYGLELQHKNPVANLRAEFRAIAKLEGMNWMKEELLRTGKGIYIEKTADAPIQWERVNDQVFDKIRVEPNLARLINNLISTNKITRIPVLNTIRKINNFLRTIKFIGSAFHLGVIGKQSIADSGYLGFAYKKTATRGATLGFRDNDPIFRTPEYKEYIELGGGHKYSVEFEAKKVLVNFVDKVNRGNYLGAFTSVGIFPAKIPAGFVNWMFNSYIPKVKYAKYLDFVAKKEKNLGKMATDKEKIDIIKEGQNFYGMMNERLFGRSGTTTTTLRFIFMAPGFAEGNYRTIIKAFSQWGAKGTYGAGRSRFNIVNSLILTGILATVGTLIFTKKPPEKPKGLEDIRDLFKIDTGYTDDKGRKVMIDLMTYDKDYWNVTFNVLKGRPDKAITESITRLGGMKAPTFEMLTDFALMLQGKAIYDWKGDEIMELTDPFLIKLQKLTTHEIKRLEPISMSVYKQLRNKDVDRTLAFVESALGVRPAKTEEDKRIQKITSRIYSLKGQQEELYQYLGTINKPKQAVERYNKMVNDVLNSKMVPKEMKEEWEPKLLVDTKRLLSNKVYSLTDPMTTLTDEEKEKEIERNKKYLQNFEVSIEEAKERLKYYWEEHPVKNKWSSTHRKNVSARKRRLEERF